MPAGTSQIRVCAPARLHLGFLDLHGGLGRRFGSVGVAIEGVETRLRLRPAREDVIEGPQAARAAALVAPLRAGFGLRTPLHVVVEEAIPEHQGLGSGTQLGLALAAGVARLTGAAPDARGLARLVERGARSGIGVGAFEGGGLIVDGGRAEGSDAPPPVVARLPVPPRWRFVLILDRARRGLHGEAERAAFAALPSFDPALAGHLCRLLLLRLLPAVAEDDVRAAGDALTEIQARVGDHFAPAQGGRFASPAVAAALERLARAGAAGVGQSSWGPTGFALAPDEAAARDLARLVEPPLRALVVRARDGGAEITAAPIEEDRRWPRMARPGSCTS